VPEAVRIRPVLRSDPGYLLASISGRPEPYDGVAARRPVQWVTSSVSVQGSYLAGSHNLAIGGSGRAPRRVVVRCRCCHFCCHRPSSRRWVMSRMTSVSAVSGSLRYLHWPRPTGHGCLHRWLRVSLVSSRPAASRAQIRAQIRPLTCWFPCDRRISGDWTVSLGTLWRCIAVTCVSADLRAC
jgi:hypothetical protein